MSDGAARAPISRPIQGLVLLSLGALLLSLGMCTGADGRAPAPLDETELQALRDPLLQPFPVYTPTGEVLMTEVSLRRGAVHLVQGGLLVAESARSLTVRGVQVVEEPGSPSRYFVGDNGEGAFVRVLCGRVRLDGEVAPPETWLGPELPELSAVADNLGRLYRPFTTCQPGAPPLRYEWQRPIFRR